MSRKQIFKDFNKKIRLPQTKSDRLKNNRLVLRNKIKVYFSKKGWTMPQFYSQGSYPLRTGLNPIDGEYDLDDGVYFICSKDEREAVSTYHDRIVSAVKNHTSKKTKDKNTCVRVVYANDYHIDLPIYWKEDIDTCWFCEEIPQLAHKSKGYMSSDPRAFKEWVDKKISGTSGQLRRIIRFLKSWKDYRENCNQSLRLPSGFILTVLACEFYQNDGHDDVALQRTVKNIYSNLSDSFECYRPTDPTDEDLLESYDENVFLDELKKFIKNSDNALNNSITENEYSIKWQKNFGNRFPSGDTKALDLSYVKQPEWQMKNSNSVSITAKFSNNNFNSGELLDKGHSLIFRATTNTLKPFTVYWQVVNTGQTAANEADLRGEITKSEIAGAGGLVKDCKEERTSYSGSHWVECFVVKNNQCVARSGQFIVRIK